MARYPLAIWEGDSHETAGEPNRPFRIVHFTTETPNVATAKTRYALSGKPHFTVDEHGVYQHIDTDAIASALPGHDEGSIEVAIVGLAGKPKNRAALRHLAELCRWLEQAHSIPKLWPNGPTLPAANGCDPGRHNRSPKNWEQAGGHFGRCHIPGEADWGPGYTLLEWQLAMSVVAIASAQTPFGNLPIFAAAAS